MSKTIDVKVINYEPNLLILKNYIIVYDIGKIILYDLNGEKLNEYISEYFWFDKIIKINDNNFISFYSRTLYKIEINNNNIKVYILKIFNNHLDLFDLIKNILFIKENNILIVSFLRYFKLIDIDTLCPIQTIYNNI